MDLRIQEAEKLIEEAGRSSTRAESVQDDNHSKQEQECTLRALFGPRK